jgi:hypothetical protein
MAEKRPENERPHGTPKAPTVEEQLDEALANSFPASDPVSFVTSQTEEDWGDTPANGAQPRRKP